MDKQPHLLVCISSHGYGHLAQTAPVLNALCRRMPELRLTIRSLAPLGHLQSRMHAPFDHVREGADVGMLMSSALDVRVEASAESYLALHRDWDARVVQEAAALRALQPDFVLSNIGYLPLAGARHAGIPCAAMCSLNWADIHAHYCGAMPGAQSVSAQIRAAYDGAEAFLRLTPGMPMRGMRHLVPIGPVAEIGNNRRDEIDARLGLAAGEKLVLVSLGGIASRLPMERWPRFPGVRWLIQKGWQAAHPDAVVLESLDMPFGDLLASSDAFICKPGYGSFVEAACSGVPVIYSSREDWPETPALKAWLAVNGACREVGRSALEAGDFAAVLDELLRQPRPRPVTPAGVDEAAAWLEPRLRG